MTIRLAPRFSAWAGAAVIAGLFTPAALVADPAKGSRPGLPPVVELGTGEAPTAPAPAREALADLLQQLESLQTELRQLRGQMEMQANEIERLKARQRELLTDIDRRVRDLEQRAAAAPSGATSAEGIAALVAAAPATPPPPTAQEQQDYDAAFNLLKQGAYERAAKAFRDFIAKYPHSALRGNAQYWLGEAYYVAPNFRQALEEFTKVLKDYPQNPKAPDALLKIGYCYYELHDWAKARDNLNQVLARYPGTAPAKSAEQRLAKMKKEGH